MKTVMNRIYSDYLMPSRLAEYDALLGEASAAGYTQLSVRGFFRALGKPGERHRIRICLLTHAVQWETNWGESTRCNVRRLAEELAWRA